MTTTPIAMSMLCAESTDGRKKVASESRKETSSTATDENMAEVAVDAIASAMNQDLEDNVDDCIDAFVVDTGESPKSEKRSSSFSNDSVARVNYGCLVPVEAEGVTCMVETPTQSAQGESAETVNPPIFTETDKFDAIDDIIEPYENIFNSATADNILMAQMASERLQGDVATNFEDDMNDAVEDGFLSTFDAMGTPTSSKNAGFDEYDTAKDGIVNNHDGNNSITFTSEVQGNDIDADTVNNKPDFFDMHNSNDKLNVTEGGSQYFLNSSGLFELENGAMDNLGQSTSTFQTEADSPEISSIRKEVEIIHESVIDSTCLSADLDVFSRDEFSNTEIMASTSNGMDLNGENLASSDPTMSNSEYPTKQDAITSSVDEDFRESAFLEVETGPTDGIPSFNEATPNPSALVGCIKSMSEIVDRNSSSRPDGSATEESTLNESHDVNNNKSDLVLGESNPSVVSERLKVTTSSIANTPDAELEHANSFGDMLSHEDSFVDKQSEHISSFQDNGFGGFEAFAGMSEAAIPNEQGASVLDELDSPVEKEGNDPSPFQGILATKKFGTTVSDDHHRMTLVAEESVQSLPEVATNDEEFGDFGGFEFGDSPADKLSDASNTMNAANEEVDEFGDFGDFNAFEEAPAKEITPPVLASGTLPKELVRSVVNDDGDEFGDFNEFEAFDSAPDSTEPEEIGATTKSGSKSQQMSFLNENVRRMFQGVFAYNDPATSSVGDGGTCSRLPFDVPMSKILSALSPPREIDPTHTPKSEQELAALMTFYANLPVSPPSTVLSKEKWYPYSQYEFNRDGSPYVPTVEIVPTSSVPEVLSIELPTGFETIDSSSSTTIPSPPLPVTTDRSAPTVVVDFSSTQTRMNHGIEHDSLHGVEESFEPDLSQLSDEGKKFMESIPDLSYMLNSTLSLPKV